MRKHLLLFTALFVATRRSFASPPVEIKLRSSWPAPPFLLEVLETISDQNPDAFFPLLNNVVFPSLHKILHSPPQEVYQLILDAALTSQYLSNDGTNTAAAAKMSLGLHTATPKIEASYQYYLDRHAARWVSAQNGGKECGSWVDWYGQVVCDVETLVNLVDANTTPSSGSSSPKLFSFDHVQPALTRLSPRPARTAILYASISSPNFRSLHQYLYSMSSEASPSVEYVLRSIPTEDRSDDSNRKYLSGYGVSLDLKKMEYLAVDDRNSRRDAESGTSTSGTQSELDSQSDPIVTLLQHYSENTTDYTSSLTSTELLSIGYQSAQLIYDAAKHAANTHADSPDAASLAALKTFKHLSQNFPKYATTVARRVVIDEALDEEVYKNQMKAQGGANAAWLNGVVLNDKDLGPFALLKAMRKERNIMHSLSSQGFTTAQSINLLTHQIVGASQSESGLLDGMFDASDRAEGGDVIMWWNDFEKDSRYDKWNPDVRLLLRPMYPGQLPTVKQNLFNIVIVADLSQSGTLNFIGGMVSNIISRNFPFRFGVVPILETDEGQQMARLFHWLVENVGRAKTMQFIQHIGQLNTPKHLLTYSVQWDVVRNTFKALLSSLTPEDALSSSTSYDLLRSAKLDDILRGKWRGSSAGDSEVNWDAEGTKKLDKAKAYAKRLAVSLASASQGSAFVNGKYFELNDNFVRQMQTELTHQTAFLQEQLYGGTLTAEQESSMSTYFYDLPTSSKRRNKHIFPTSSSTPSVTIGSLKVLNLPDLHRRSRLPIEGGAFVYPETGDNEEVPVTTYIVADLDSKAGLGLVKDALETMQSSHTSRFGFIHNPSRKHGSTRVSSLIGRLVTTAELSTYSPTRLWELISAKSLGGNGNGEQTVLGGGTEKKNEVFEAASRYIVQELNLAPGEQALIVNGRIVGPFAQDDFDANDIKLLISYEYRKRVQPVVEALVDIFGSLKHHSRESFATLVSMTSSIVSAIRLPEPSEAGLFNAPQRPRLRNYQLLGGQYTKFEFGKNETALFHFGFLLDPLSEPAQKLVGVIEWLLNDPTVFVELHINPLGYRELPLKRFYRYNLPGELAFTSDGQELQSLLTFTSLPTEPIYTLAMDVPQSWLVRPREAQYDLDNIQLSAVPREEHARGIQATFDLDYLVIEGHARESLTMSPPRGLQLQLSASGSGNNNSVETTPIADTQVVANLGYLQFKVKPGVFKLDIRPGRGREVFQVESVGNEGWDSPDVNTAGDEVALASFEGLTLYPRFSRVKGMEEVDVLAPQTEKSEEPKGLIMGLLSGFTSVFLSKSAPPKAELALANDHAEINIFTVASGLLYERFASIMILSVLRNTNSTVKFWFIENFLSPSFLEFIPHFAKAYNFKYELITYKWPSWLRAQKEKQRIIWAYKILFLDVLFPMDLKKVIFVDADQIVRADLKELVDLDLHGAPYGYTPMGDDNTDMEGFRFWKTGYWKDFLGGLPYHISALYVVDLVQFRQMAAGDMLRGHYQQLSADPHSLANLDQDLPNNLQREVPIFSLPEDWLWCETWCSKDRLDRAKTIDLCQNPLTKEPKLSRARQIPEWSTYDAEIAKFARELAERGDIHSGMAAADANVLADQAAGVAKVVDADVKPTAEERVKDEL